ncbi:MAG: hypothetical protein ACFFBP_02910 [Promethearchaeota archaeon]
MSNIPNEQNIIPRSPITIPAFRMPFRDSNSLALLPFDLAKIPNTNAATRINARMIKVVIQDVIPY